MLSLWVGIDVDCLNSMSMLLLILWSAQLLPLCFFFFFNDTATTEIYTLSLHDALPICSQPTVLSTQSSVLAAGRTGSETIVAPVRRGVPGSPPTRIAAAGLARPAGGLSEDGAARACPRWAIRQRVRRRAVRAAGGGGVLTRPAPGNGTRRKAHGAGNQGLRRRSAQSSRRRPAGRPRAGCPDQLRGLPRRGADPNWHGPRPRSTRPLPGRPSGTRNRRIRQAVLLAAGADVHPPTTLVKTTSWRTGRNARILSFFRVGWTRFVSSTTMSSRSGSTQTEVPA